MKSAGPGRVQQRLLQLLTGSPSSPTHLDTMGGRMGEQGAQEEVLPGRYPEIQGHSKAPACPTHHLIYPSAQPWRLALADPLR